MTSRFFPEKNIRNAQISRPVNARVFAWLTIIALAGALISCGFVISANQHFDAVALGYEGEKLRQEANQLEEKRRRLELERARALSPLEIERRAQKIGLSRPDSKSKESAAPAQTGATRTTGR